MTPAEVEEKLRDLGGIVCQRHRFHRLEKAEAGLLVRAADALASQAAEIERMRGALERLRDCDWVITPLDRMDAVRDIARQALGDPDQ